MVGTGLGACVGGVVGVAVAGRRVRVGVGDAVLVGSGVGVHVGVGVRVGIGVALGSGVFVSVGVGVGVMDGVRDGVRLGTSTRTGTSLAIACTALIAWDGRKPSNFCSSHDPARRTHTITKSTPAPVSRGRNQSCRSDSPQDGQTL